MIQDTHKYPTTRTICVDVDGTLICRGEINARLVEWCRQRKADGFVLMLWSARGQQYAASIAERHGVTDVFDHIISKPGYVVDDMGLGWTKYIKTVLPSACTPFEKC